MKLKSKVGLWLGAALGVYVGMRTGVAGGGGAVSGLFVFPAIGALIGWLVVGK